LAWFVLDVVDQVDLHPFLAADRADGHGRVADQARMLLGQDRSSTPPVTPASPATAGDATARPARHVKRRRLV
jgi:hypothetical protein